MRMRTMLLALALTLGTLGSLAALMIHDKP
jgi:hypothetical protein